ncbi:MAG: hypothetical protein R3F56_23510 [Planctomycetota bacterium]
MVGNVVRVQAGACVRSASGKLRNSIVDGNRFMFGQGGSALSIPASVGVLVGDDL